MAKGGLLQTLAPILGIGAALAAPEILPALGAGEAAGGAGAAATLADTAGGIAPEAILAAPEGGLAGAATGVATPLAADALSTIPELGAAGGGLLAADAASGITGGAAGGAVPSLGETTGGLLGAGQAAPPVPLADTAATAAPVDTGVMAATPAAPTIPGYGLPPGVTPSPDFTGAGGLSGPAPGETVNMFATYADTAGADGAPTYSDISNAVFGPSLLPAGDAASTAGGGGGIGDFAGRAGDWALQHPGALLTAGIAGEQFLKGNPSYPGAQSIQQLAAPLGAQGVSTVGTGVSGLQGQAATTAGETAALTAPLTTGILPPGLQQGIDQAARAQKAQVRSTYADLAGSTMEADKLAQIDANTAAQKASIAEGLLPAAEAFSQQTNQAFSDISRVGAGLSGLSLDAYNTLLRTQMQSDQNYQTALYKFAAALAGGGYKPPVANA